MSKIQKFLDTKWYEKIFIIFGFFFLTCLVGIFIYVFWFFILFFGFFIFMGICVVKVCNFLLGDYKVCNFLLGDYYEWNKRMERFNRRG